MMRRPGTEAGAESPAEQRRIAAQNRLEWEFRVRSPDPMERGAGWWVPIMEPADEPMPDYEVIGLFRDNLAISGACVAIQARVVRVIEDPTAAARKIRAARAVSKERVGPEPREDISANRFAYSSRQNARRTFLAWAAFFGAAVIELRQILGRFWVFDVALSQEPGGECRRVQRWVLRLEPEPVVIQAQLPAFMPMVLDEPQLRFPPNFPQDQKILELVVGSFDPSIGPFAVEMYRWHARDLCRALFGPVGSRDVPNHRGGVLEWRLPRGWTLRLDYKSCGDGFEDAGEVLAHFIPASARALEEAA